MTYCVKNYVTRVEQWTPEDDGDGRRDDAHVHLLMQASGEG